MAAQLRTMCVTCARGAGTFVQRYRTFLLEPGTLVTLASLTLLIVAVILDPAGLFASGGPLYLAAALVGSVYIWWSAIQGIRAGDFTADIPVSVATAAAIAIGEYAAAAVVAALLLVGGMLEEFVAARAGRALEALEKLLPNQVTLRRAGRDVVVALEEVTVGDVLLVRPGERIAVDGTVLSGAAAVDQATITGESVAVDKQPGDTVFAGTLVQGGALEVRADRIGDDTTLGQIRRMVAEAQERRAPIERLLDRYARLYTPIALVLGALLWWWSGDILRAITILIVFCPCVMVLATPTALVASIGNAALRGSLIKQGATIEKLAQIDTIAFDKTGTLTAGQPRLAQLVSLNGQSPDNLLALAASAEKFSEHPLGEAVVRAATGRGLSVPDPADFAALPGLGVRAQVDGHTVLLGRPQLMTEHGMELPDAVNAQVSTLTAQGQTVILAAIDREIAGLLLIEDELRPEAARVVTRLHQLGLRTVLISGDSQATTERIAGTLGITDVHAEVLPQQKMAIVRQLQNAGRKVLFVGDGVNDAPALATADVGVAMGVSGTDVAIETAEVALLADDLTKLPHLLRLSRQAIRAIHQNLVFSLGVLVLAVGLTIPGLLNPVAGALLHELSSLPVLANSARLIGLREQAG